MRQNSFDTINLLYSESRQLENSRDLEELHWRLYRLIEKVIPFDAFYIGYYGHWDSSLDVRFIVDGGKQYSAFSETIANSIAGHAIANKSPIVLSSRTEILDLIGPGNVKAIGRTDKSPSSILCSPIILAGEVVGVLSLQSYRENTYSNEAGKLLYIVCMQVAPILHYRIQAQSGGGVNGFSRPQQRLPNKDAHSGQAVADSVTRQNEKLRSVIDFARRICHEMNQPLTGISGYCALIREELKGDQQVFEDLNQIELQAQRLENLIYNFQSIAQLEDLENVAVEE